MLWAELVLNAGSALGGAVIGAVATVYFQRRADRAKEKETIRFRVYLKLLDCQDPLFWMSCSEMHRDELGQDGKARALEHKRAFEQTRMRLADELRKIDDLPQMERILRVLFSEKYESAIRRHEDLMRVIDDLGNACNPRFCQVARKISEENLRLTASKFEQIEQMMARGDKPVQDDLEQRPKKDNMGTSGGT